MKEKLYTIPVTDAFKETSECPLCSMYRHLETASIEYTMGPSYMEDDVREETNQIGFCQHHIKLMYQNQNRLGLALMLSTHMDHTLEVINKLSKEKKTVKGNLFKKAPYTDLKSYIDYLENSCFVCKRINHTFNRYVATIFYLYKTEPDFRNTFVASKGFCTKHYGELYQQASESLKGNQLENFIDDLNSVYLSNMKRVRDDLEWFKDKFDYQNKDKPWNNSQDALPRTITKTNSLLED